MVRARFHVIVLLSMVFFFGCQEGSTPQTSTPSAVSAVPATTMTSARGGVDMLDQFAAIAPHLPADTMGMLSVDLGMMMDSNSDLAMLAGAIIGDQYYQAMKKEISELLTERIGIDPFSLKWVAVGVSESGWGIVFLGGVTLPASMTRKKINGLDVVLSKSGDARFVELNGMVGLLPTEKDLENFSKLKSGGATLVASPRLEMLLAFAKEASGDALSITVALDSEKAREELAGALPPQLMGLRGGAIGVGSVSAFSLIVKGDKGSISALKGFFDMFKQSMIAEVEGARKTLDKMDTADALGVVIASHGLRGLLEKFSPTFSGETARMDLKITGLGGGTVFGTFFVTGMLGFLTFAQRKEEVKAQAYPDKMPMKTDSSVKNPAESK